MPTINHNGGKGMKVDYKNLFELKKMLTHDSGGILAIAKHFGTTTDNIWRVIARFNLRQFAHKNIIRQRKLMQEQVRVKEAEEAAARKKIEELPEKKNKLSGTKKKNKRG